MKELAPAKPMIPGAEGALRVKTGERVRTYFGDIGHNFASSFHVIGSIF